MFDTVQKPTIESVQEAWKSQYFTSYGDRWREVLDSKTYKMRSAELVYNDLMKAQTLEECDQAIGNTSWTAVWCNCCNKQSKEEMICLEVAGDEYTHNICETCVNEMKMTLIKAQGLD